MATPIFETRPERRRAKPSVALIVLAVLGAEAIGLATLCPIGLRPHLWSANYERFAAYLVLGALVGLAAQRRWLSALALTIFLAFGLEAAQRLIPGRHAMLSDATVKALGGVLGCAVAQVGFVLRRRLAAAPAGALPAHDGSS